MFCNLFTIILFTANNYLSVLIPYFLQEIVLQLLSFMIN